MKLLEKALEEITIGNPEKAETLLRMAIDEVKKLEEDKAELLEALLWANRLLKYFRDEAHYAEGLDGCISEVRAAIAKACNGGRKCIIV